jgi:hypothetical protein
MRQARAAGVAKLRYFAGQSLFARCHQADSVEHCAEHERLPDRSTLLQALPNEAMIAEV